jgi:hypothetical protein
VVDFPSLIKRIRETCLLSGVKIQLSVCRISKNYVSHVEVKLRTFITFIVDAGWWPPLQSYRI